MVGRVATAMAIAALALPATARAAPAAVLRAPGGVSLAIRDGAARFVQRPPLTIDRFGSLTWDVFCLRLAVPGDAGECEGQTLPTPDDPVAFTEVGTWIGGAVPAAAATVEIVPDRGPAVVAPALAGDYHGAYAGRVKFFVAEIERDAQQIRAFDAAGALIGGGFESGPLAVGGRVRLGGGRRWSAGARVEEIESPAAGAPERRERADCLRVSLAPRDRDGSAIPLCGDARRAAGGLLDLFADCGTGRTALAALLPPGVRRAVLTLGDGRRLALPGRRLPARFGAAQSAVAAVVPRGAAIRTVSAGGRVRRLAQAPATAACAHAPHLAGLDGSGIPGPFTGFAAHDLFPPPQAPVAGAEPVAGSDLLAAPRGDDLCVGLGAPPTFPDGCAPAPAGAEDTRFGGRGREVGVVTAPAVTAVQLLAAGTQRPLVSAPTVPAGAGRAAVLDAPASRGPLVARLLGADGLPLADVGLAPAAVGPHRTVARGRGWVVTATRIGTPQAERGAVEAIPGTCVQVARRVPHGLSDDCLDDGTGRVRVLATCAPRVVHVFGAGARPTLVLASGRRRVPGKRHGAWHALLRGRETLRAVRVHGHTTPVSVPPAAAQCGYGGVVVG